MAEGSFEEIFKLKSRKEFAVNPISLTGYLIDKKFPSEDIRTYRSMARMCPAVVSKVLRGDISAEDAASQASKQAKVDVSIARSLFERMSARPEVKHKTIVHMVEPAQKPEPSDKPVDDEPVVMPEKKKTIVSKEASAHTDIEFKGVKETSVDGMEFELSLREARLKRCNRANPGASIPKTVNGLPVTIIGKEAYKDCEPIAFSITLPETVVKIEEKAFEGCHRLESIVLPNSLKKIGDCAFSRCRSLKTDIPDSVAEIGRGAFEYCTSLESIEFPRIAAVSDLCFSHCVHLKSIDIPDTVTSIGDYAFEHCVDLAPVNLPPSLNSIGKGSFRGCKKTESIEIPDSVTEIDSEAFCSCTDLKKIKLPK
ncbi:MAG: leucine-rich repeat domain-containing protein [Candidatus Methanomethylophilaceae archaeon]|nr:leucine-rich repeat domain-containing protein [Candidatus Methanomethylophilaceae archaeon]